MSTFEDILAAALHNIVPVADQPETHMTEWRLFRVLRANGKRTRHLIGRADWEGRVSSDIVEFELAALRATTQSGRVYHLDGPPGQYSDADWVFERWLRVNGAHLPVDITGALLRLRKRHLSQKNRA
jgi:hypothetical protein